MNIHEQVIMGTYAFISLEKYLGVELLGQKIAVYLFQLFV